jgi:hypothetical protein
VIASWAYSFPLAPGRKGDRPCGPHVLLADPPLTGLQRMAPTGRAARSLSFPPPRDRDLPVNGYSPVSGTDAIPASAEATPGAKIHPAV